MSEIPKEQPLTAAAKKTAITAFIKKVEKEYGPNTLMRVGSRNVVPVPVIPTKLVHLDHEALMAGGFPRGRVIEIFGPESSGKTTLALHVIAQAQKAGGTAAFVDAEHALDPIYAGKLGVNVDDLLLNQPDDAEQGLNMVDGLIDTQAVDIIVLDSVAALVSKAELAGDIGDAHVGILARLMSQTLRIITGKLSKLPNKPCVVFINQIREKIGVMYGNPETQPGGRALKFYSSVRLDVRRKEYIKHKEYGDKPIGMRQKVKCIKNKVGSPFRESFLDLYYPDSPYGAGYDMKVQTLDLAFERGIIYKEGTGTTFFFDGKKIEIGEPKTRAAVLEDSDLYDAVEKAVVKALVTPITPKVAA